MIAFGKRNAAVPFGAVATQWNVAEIAALLMRMAQRDDDMMQQIFIQIAMGLTIDECAQIVENNQTLNFGLRERSDWS